MLRHLLVDPDALHAPFSRQSEVLVPCQGNNSPDSMAGNGNMGICSGSTLQWTVR